MRLLSKLPMKGWKIPKPSSPVYSTIYSYATGNRDLDTTQTITRRGWYRFYYYNSYSAGDRYARIYINGVQTYSWSNKNSGTYTGLIYLNKGDTVRFYWHYGWTITLRMQRAD